MVSDPTPLQQQTSISTKHPCCACSSLHTTPQAGASSNLIPPDTRVESFLTMNHVASSFDLVLKTNNDTTIRGVVLFGEQIFPEESLFMFPKVGGLLFLDLRTSKVHSLAHVYMGVLVGEVMCNACRCFPCGGRVCQPN